VGEPLVGSPKLGGDKSLAYESTFRIASVRLINGLEFKEERWQ